MFSSFFLNNQPDEQGFEHWFIQVALIVLFTLIALMVVIPGKGSRGQALQRLTWLLGITLGFVAIIFPDLTTSIANAVGVGRGTDLVFYLLIVFFIGHVLLATRRQTNAERDITRLARKIALLEAEKPINNQVNKPTTD